MILSKYPQYPWLARIAIIIPSLFFLFLMLSTILGSIWSTHQVIINTDKKFHEIYDNLIDIITEEVLDLGDNLQGAQGFFAASKSVERDEWREYAKQLVFHQGKVTREAIGFAQKVSEVDKTAHIESVKQEGFGDYQIWPQTKKEIYFPVLFLEPLKKDSQKLLGYDFYSEEEVGKLMDQARDQDQTMMIEKSDFSLSGQKLMSPTLIFFYPVFKNNVPHIDIYQRRENIVGFVFILINSNKFISNLLEEHNQAIHFQIFKEMASNRLLIYDNQNGLSDQPDSKLCLIEHSVKLFNQTWVIRITGYLENNDITPYIILWGGTFISVLVFLLTRGLFFINTNVRKLAEQMNNDLFQAKSKLETVLNSAPIGIFLTNEAGGCVYTNPAYQKIVGRSFEECRGEGWQYAIHPDDRQRVYREWAEASRLNKKYLSHHRFIRPDGEVSMARVQAVSIDKGHVGMVEDITDLYDYQEALKESDAFSRNSLEELKRLRDDEAKHIQTLERMNKLMVDRELKMIELKNIIKEYKKKLNES